MDGIRYFSQAVRETDRIHLPVPDRIGPVVLVLPVRCLLVPSGIEPEDFRDQPELFVPFHQRHGIVGRQASIFIARGRVTVVEARAYRVYRRLSVHLRMVMGQHEPAEPVLPDHPVITLPQ